MKKNMKKNMKRIKKNEKLNKDTKKRLIRKQKPEAKDATKDAAKAEKAILKDISARGLKLFLSNRKTVSGLKKLTKLIAKHLTEANKTGNKKLVDHCVKMFGYIGFKYDAAANTVRWEFEAKVKPFKERKVMAAAKVSDASEDDKKEKPSKKTREKKPRKAKVARTKNPVVKDAEDVKPAEETPTQPSAEETSTEPIEIAVGDTTDLADVEAGSQTVDDEGLEDDEDIDDESDSDDDGFNGNDELRGDEVSEEQAEARLDFFNHLDANGEDIDA